MGFFDFLFGGSSKQNNKSYSTNSYRNNSDYDRGYEDGYEDSCVDNHCDYCDGPEEYHEHFEGCDDGEYDW